MKSQAVVFTGVQRVEVLDIEIPEPEAGEVLVASEYTCVSPGTELRCLAGRQHGASFPFIPGYASVGRVLRAGPGVTLAPGTRVFSGGTKRASVRTLWGGHSAHAVMPADAARPLAPGADPVASACSRLAAISYHGYTVSRPLPTETVAVLGLGPIGMIAALAHRMSGARVIGIDRAPARVELARELGLEAVVAVTTPEAALQPLLPQGAHVVVDSTGVPAVLPHAVRLGLNLAWNDQPSPGPRLLLQGSYPDDFTLNYNELFQREMSVLVPRDSKPADQAAVLELVAQGKLNLRRLVSALPRPSEVPAAYARLAAPGAGWMTFAVDWMGAGGA